MAEADPATATVSLLLFFEGLPSLKDFGVARNKTTGSPIFSRWSGLLAARTSEPWRRAVIGLILQGKMSIID